MSDTHNGDFDPSQVDPALLATFPALSPPPGMISNFENPATLEYHARGVIYVLLPLMILHVLLRFYTRIFVTRTLGWDDYTCGLAMLASIAWSAIALQMLGSPLGPHQWNVRLIELNETFVKLSAISSPVYNFLAAITRISIGILYWRLFHQNWASRQAIRYGIVVISLFYASNIIAACLLCIPRRGEEWTSETSKRRCAQPQLVLSVCQGIFGVISDFYLLGIPLARVFKLQISSGKKMGLTAVFLSGLLACACSITLCIYRFKQRGTDDFTWMAVPVYALASAEINVGIITSCMPVVFVIFKGVGQTLRTKMSSVTSTLRRSGKRRRSETEAIEDGKQLTDGEQASPQKLPSIPKGTLGTLMSFIRKPSLRRDNKGTLRQDSIMLSSMSMDSTFDGPGDGYHAHVNSMR